MLATIDKESSVVRLVPTTFITALFSRYYGLAANAHVADFGHQLVDLVQDRPRAQQLATQGFVAL